MRRDSDEKAVDTPVFCRCVIIPGTPGTGNSVAVLWVPSRSCFSRTEILYAISDGLCAREGRAGGDQMCGGSGRQ